MNEEICYSTATELAQRIRSRDLSPVEVVRAHLERIDAVNPALNAIVTPAEDALHRAKDAEAALVRGDAVGPLHGVPFTAKDSVDIAGIRTTRGSRLFSDHVPDADAVAAARLKDAGAIFMGHTNVPEFVFWFETDNEVFGRTQNPWNMDRTPGGSSGGEAAAIAAGLSPLGIGSDVGCSIRLPASYCGIVGLKPTQGRVPLTGHWPEALLRYMHVGPMARTVGDIALALSIMSGPDGLDPYAVPVPVEKFEDIDGPPLGLRVGFCTEGPFGPVAAEVQDAVAVAASTLSGLGCTVEPVSLDAWDSLPGQDISLTIYGAEVTQALEPIITGREDQLSPAIRARLSGPGPTAREYQQALADCERLRAEVAKYFTKYDLLLCPMGIVPAHPHRAEELDVDGELVPPRNALRAAVPFDLTGSPAISIPFGWSSEGLPIGVQIVGRHFDERSVLKAAAALETSKGDAMRPPLPA